MYYMSDTLLLYYEEYLKKHSQYFIKITKVQQDWFNKIALCFIQITSVDGSAINTNYSMLNYRHK
jgi:hypothetical protein